MVATTPCARRRALRAALPLVGALLLVGCAGAPKPTLTQLPTLPAPTEAQQELQDLPRPSRPVSIAVYGFTDQTGQFKNSDVGQTLSRAVSQGGTPILIKALQDAGQRRWFTVVEREQLKNLLTERQIIQEMRGRYLGEKEVNPDALPSLLFAGVILEGGIIGYDSNTKTGGAGAGFLGINANTQYRQDTVTVSLRAISVRTGEVLSSVTASKTIASFSLGANAFRYVGFKKLLEVETGITSNEPDQLALQQAVEKAVYAMIMEGAEQKLWGFADPQAAAPLIERYRQEREGLLSSNQVAAVARQERKDRPPTPRYEDDAALRRGSARTAQVQAAPVRRASVAAGDPIGDMLFAAVPGNPQR